MFEREFDVEYFDLDKQSMPTVDECNEQLNECETTERWTYWIVQMEQNLWNNVSIRFRRFVWEFQKPEQRKTFDDKIFNWTTIDFSDGRNDDENFVQIEFISNECGLFLCKIFITISVCKKIDPMINKSLENKKNKENQIFFIVVSFFFYD